jgi:hypothetical protein
MVRMVRAYLVTSRRRACGYNEPRMRKCFHLCLAMLCLAVQVYSFGTRLHSLPVQVYHS